MLIASDLRLALDPIAFAEAAGITPDPWQADLLCEAPRRALLCCSRQSGKSTTTALHALHTAAFESESLCVLVAPAQRQSAEMLRTIRQLHAKVPGLPELIGDSVLKIEMRNGSRILALPGDNAGATVRGLAKVRLAILDEASRIQDDVLGSIRPMLATNARGALIALSTPAGRRGWFFEAWHGDPDAYRRISVPATMCPRITPEFLEEERKQLGEARFQEEYMLAWLDSEQSAFSSTIIDLAFDPEVRPLWH